MSGLIDVASKSGLKRTRKGRDSSTISEWVSSLILNAKTFSPSRRDATAKLLLTIDAHSDGVEKRKPDD
jgi:hypothetical protein